MSNSKPTYQDLERQIIQLKSENLLLQKKDHFSMLIKESENMITIHKPNGKYIYYNESKCYDVKAKDIVGKMPQDLLDEEVATVLLKTFKRVVETGKSERLEIFVDWLGEKKWFSEYIYPLKNEEGKIVELVKISKDIHKRKVAEQVIEEQNKEKAKRVKELEISKQKIQTTLDLLEKSEYSKNEASKTAKIGYHQYDIATDTFIWSDYLYHFFAFDPKKPVPPRNEIIPLFDEDSQKKIAKATLELDSKGVPYDLELRIINLKKEEVWVRNIAAPVYNSKKEIIGRRGITQDITHQKLIEQKNLIISENYKKLFDNTTVSILNEDFSAVIPQILELKKLKIPNLELYFNQNPEVLLEILDKVKIIKVNKATLKLFKVNNSKEFIDNIQDTFGKGANKVFSKFIEAIWNNKKTFTSEINYKTLKGDQFVAVVSIPIPQTAIEQKTVPVSIQSIQSIKDAQFAEKESLKKLRAQSEFITAMTENQPAGIIACDSEGKLVLFNKIAKEWHGIGALKIPQEELAKNYDLYKVDGETLLEKHEIPLLKAFRGEKVANVEIIIKAQNQKPRNIICSGTSFSDSIGNKLGAIIVMNDITEQKVVANNLKRSQSEIKETVKELERSEFLFNESGRLARVGGWELKLPSREVRWSNHVFEIHGLPVGKVPPLEECLNFYIEGSAKILADAIEKSITENKKFDLVLRFKNKQNKKLWINSIGYPLANKKGEVTSLIGVFQDITLQKDRQNKLDAQNERLNLLNKALNEAQEVSRLGSWEYISATGNVTWSKEMYTIFDRKDELKAPNYEEHKRYLTEEHFAKMDRSIQNCLKHGTPYNIELDISTENNSFKHLILRGRVIKDKESKVIGCYGTAQDITELKQASQKIEEAEKMYRLLTDNSNDLICLHKPDSTFKYISPSVETLLGYQQAELQGKKALSIIHKEEVDELKETLKKRALKGVFTESFSCRVLHKKGHYVWLEFLASPVYKNEEISHFVSSARDISQSVIVKKEIQEYQKSLQKLTTEITLIEEKQKKEIASNIHDHLSQSLVISKMKINELKKISQLKGIQEDLKFIETHISEALENSRKITYELSPPILYKLGIIDALNWLLEKVESTHKINYLINTNVSNIKLDDAESILLFRSIQEVINNVIKHANATLITLNLDKSKSGLTIYITDNGDGFDATTLDNNHNNFGSGFGLFTVKERIRNIQGEFSIKSKINIGTTIKIFISLSK